MVVVFVLLTLPVDAAHGTVYRRNRWSRRRCSAALRVSTVMLVFHIVCSVTDPSLVGRAWVNGEPGNLGISGQQKTRVRTTHLLQSVHSGQLPSEEPHDSATCNRLTVGRTLQPRQFVAGRSYSVSIYNVGGVIMGQGPDNMFSL